MKKIIYILGLFIVMTSCSSGFLKEYSQDLSRVQTYEDLNELLVGSAYLPLGLFSNEWNSFQTVNPNFARIHFMSDELDENLAITLDGDHVGSVRKSYFPYFTWQQSTFLDNEGKDTYDTFEANTWTLAYEKIGNINMILAELKNLSPSNDKEILLSKEIAGEAYFLRANYYYMLVNLYGEPYAPSTAASTLGVPVKTTEYVEDVEYTRNSVQEVYDQINKDLDAAEENLKEVTAPKTIYHAGINAVYLFRSRIYLYMQDWANAEKYAKLSLQQNSNLQELIGFKEDNYPLSSSSPESIYANGATTLGNLLIQSPGEEGNSYDTNAPIYSASAHLYGLYTEEDARKTVYFSTKDDKDSQQPCYHKIDNSSASYGKYKTASDVFMLRTPEAYLNLAEAAAQQGDNATACQYLNKLRDTRIKNNIAVSLSGADLMTFIREERERELCLEGHRWFDLRRYSVDANYPFSKVIEHTFTTFVYKSYRYMHQKTEYYRLEKNDKAYTLNIPKSVREFQVSIGSNERPVRSAFRTVNYQ